MHRAALTALLACSLALTLPALAHAQGTPSTGAEERRQRDNLDWAFTWGITGFELGAATTVAFALQTSDNSLQLGLGVPLSMAGGVGLGFLAYDQAWHGPLPGALQLALWGGVGGLLFGALYDNRLDTLAYGLGASGLALGALAGLFFNDTVDELPLLTSAPPLGGLAGLVATIFSLLVFYPILDDDNTQALLLATPGGLLLGTAVGAGALVYFSPDDAPNLSLLPAPNGLALRATW
jgi:hypothetical protein